LVIHNVDYTPFKLFQLSVLWRASVANRKEFRFVDIGEHEEIIRRMLLTSDPGAPDEYGCMLVTSKELKTLLDQVLLSPEVKQTQDGDIAQFLMAGIFWNYYLSRSNPEMDEHAAFITTDGMLSVFENSDVIKRYLHELAERWKQSGNLDDAIRRFVN
jgi:hypothetical protein